MTTGSIRFRLTVWYAGVLATVAIALSVLLFVDLHRYLHEVLLKTQARRARQIADTLIPTIGATSGPELARIMESLYAPEKSARFIRITEQGGRVLYVSGAPDEQTFDPRDVPLAATDWNGDSLREEPLPDGSSLLIANARAFDRAGVQYRVEVGTSAASVDALFLHFLYLLAIGLPGVIGLAALGGYFLVGRALEPVARIAARAEQITQHNLSERLPLSLTGDELERLSVSLNFMITRLEDAFNNSKRFVEDASHELRTPLTILRGELEHLAQDQAFASEQREQLESLLEEVQRLSALVDRMFTLSRLDAGEAQTEWVPFDLAMMVVATAEQMTLLAEDRGIAVSCRAPAAVIVKGDRSRMKQVVVNLLDNAIHYTPEGGAVRIAVRAQGHQAILEVADTGLGIATEALPFVFQRFYRSAAARGVHPGGSGLGLAIVKSICNAHGGEVEVESVAGESSCFRVKLPLAED
jgi:heavy metal sensor kinase